MLGYAISLFAFWQIFEAAPSFFALLFLIVGGAFACIRLYRRSPVVALVIWGAINVAATYLAPAASQFNPIEITHNFPRVHTLSP